MSEDPVKYESALSAVERLRIDTLTGRKEAKERAQMIRIEALRAASQYAAAHGADKADSILGLAKRFAAWLETGE